jgi:predicted amidohydrolase
MTPPFKVALIQMRVEGGEKRRNLRHAEELIAAAAAHGADLVLLPEALNLGWTHPSAVTQADAIPGGESCQLLAAAAQRYRIYLCAGLVERATDRIYNSAVLLDRQGNVRLLHRKLNELAIGHAYYAQGDRLNVCETELGTLGLMICADGFAQNQVLSRALGYMGADVIFSPSAWAVPAEHDNRKDPYGAEWRAVYSPVAKDFSLWIAAVSNVGWITGGPWAGQQCIGCSLVIGPGGEESVQGPYGVDAETILYVDISPVERPARGDGWQEYWQARANLRDSAAGVEPIAHAGKEQRNQ